jgi:hypothetical protein
MLQRLVLYWVYGGALAGVLLLILAPLLVSGWPLPLAATFLHLPAYMIHQLEEHDRDRFRLFFNDLIGGGKDVLTPLAVFVVNVICVWGLIALSLYGAVMNVGWGLIAVYLVLVNAVIHIVHGILFRRYNPGLLTAVGIFLPLGLATLVLIQRAGGGQAWSHAAGFLIAIGAHAAIIAHVLRRRKVLQNAV